MTYIIQAILNELQKSHDPDDAFFRFKCNKKTQKRLKLDLSIVGQFAHGNKWTARTGSSTVRRLNAACRKYLKCSLDLRADPCKFDI